MQHTDAFFLSIPLLLEVCSTSLKCDWMKDPLRSANVGTQMQINVQRCHEVKAERFVLFHVWELTGFWDKKTKTLREQKRQRSEAERV